MADPEQARRDEPLDEEDVERAVADTDAETFEEPIAVPIALGAYGGEPQPDEPASDDLEALLENVTAAPEEEALHEEDLVTEILDDELDLADTEVPAEVAEDLEWRLEPDPDQASPPRPAGSTLGVRPEDPVLVLMSAPAVTVGPDAVVAEVAAALDAHGLGALAVLAGDRLVGVVSERDVVRALAGGAGPTELQAVDVMADAPLRIGSRDSILSAADRMLDAGVRHLPVLADGQVLGVVSMRDVLRVLVTACRPPADEEGSASRGR